MKTKMIRIATQQARSEGIQVLPGRIVNDFPTMCDEAFDEYPDDDGFDDDDDDFDDDDIIFGD